MYIDKMIEYLILADIIRNDIPRNDRYDNYDKEKMYTRMVNLKQEFLEPYAIESNSKE